MIYTQRTKMIYTPSSPSRTVRLRRRRRRRVVGRADRNVIDQRLLPGTGASRFGVPEMTMFT